MHSGFYSSAAVVYLVCLPQPPQRPAIQLGRGMLPLVRVLPALVLAYPATPPPPHARDLFVWTT